MTSLGVFTEEELEFASNLAHVVSPSERLEEGISLQVVNGLRTWSAQTRFGQALYTGMPATFSGTYLLSPRFVSEAEYLANLGEPVEIIVNGNKAYASNELGQASMALASKPCSVKRLVGDNLTTIEI